MTAHHRRNSAATTCRLAAVLLLVVLAAACVPPGRAGTLWPTAGWPTSTPAEQGMDPTRLQQMMDLIDGQGFAYDSVLVVRHGHIVFEEYRNGYDRDKKHHLQSATKSFSSMLIGIAIHQGFLDGVDQKMVDLFPGYTIANLDARKQGITLEHLLTMSDGMDWHELDYPYTDPRNNLGQMWVSSDAVQHVLDRPMAREPGQEWAYNSGTSVLLGGILEGATGTDLLDFARTYLFDPLGIEDVMWSRTAGGGHYHTDGGLYLTPRDMARFGYLMLHGGTWDGKEIVSPEWAARSTETLYQAGQGYGYGYQWLTLDGGIYFAHGHYEQVLYVVPQADMVVVFTGDIPDDVIPPTNGLLYRYILPACTDLPSEVAHHTYADHGFTFDYPSGFSVQEMPLPGQDAASADSGIVQFRFDAYPFELVQALWLPAQPAPDLEAYLAEFVSTSQQAGDDFTAGQARAFAKDEHQALYQPFDFAQEGIRLKGATVAWYCPQSQRVYIFSYATSPEVSDGDLAARLQEHLDSFGCHAAD